MTEIFTARTVGEAKALASEKFGADEERIEFEIIDEGKKGFLGLGKSQAKVRATLKDDLQRELGGDTAAAVETETEKRAEPVVTEETAQETVQIQNIENESESESDNKTAVADVSPEQTTEEVSVKSAESAESVPEKTETAADVKSAKDTKDTKDMKEVKRETAEQYDNVEPPEEKPELVTDESLINPKVKIAVDYIKSILDAINIESQLKVYQNDECAVIDIECSKAENGTVIGRRGETLDSLQYLCSIIANKGDKNYFRITIDCQDYRSKRKETLKKLAVKVSKSVLRNGRPVPLEPMNPYERRIIHSAIADIDGVTSRSTGEEPYRKIIISPVNPAPRKKGGKPPYGKKNSGNGRGNSRQGKRREPFSPREIDLSTSFEKDYKKPRPEDDIKGGLYGKIEI